MDGISDTTKCLYFLKKALLYGRTVFQIRNEILKESRVSNRPYNTLHSGHTTGTKEVNYLLSKLDLQL